MAATPGTQDIGSGMLVRCTDAGHPSDGKLVELVCDGQGRLIVSPVSFGAILSNTPSPLNKGMTALVTTSDFDPACGTALGADPVGFVAVAVNGILYVPGAKTASCYFSADGGTTARAQGSIASGDLLYWVGSVAGFELAASDVIDFIFNA